MAKLSTGYPQVYPQVQQKARECLCTPGLLLPYFCLPLWQIGKTIRLLVLGNLAGRQTRLYRPCQP